jgi:hypothetical protein
MVVEVEAPGKGGRGGVVVPPRGWPAPWAALQGTRRGGLGRVDLVEFRVSQAGGCRVRSER